MLRKNVMYRNKKNIKKEVILWLLIPLIIFNVLLVTSIAWALVYLKKPSGMFEIPAFYILPAVWFVSLCAFCKAAQDSQKDEKIETAKKMIREQLAVYRLRPSVDEIK